MNQLVNTEIHSLGIEPLESFGFETDQDLEVALKLLMKEVEQEDFIIA